MKVYCARYLNKNRCEGEKFVLMIYMLTSNYYSCFLIKYCPVYTSSIIINKVHSCKYLILIFILFRGKRQERRAEQNPLVAFSCQEMMTRAARKMLECRSIPSSDEMQILIQRDQVNPWRSSGDLEKSNLMRSYVGHRPVMGRGSDRTVMTTYLKNVNRSGIQIPRGIKFNDFLPAGAPLLDFLAVSMDKMECWQYPSKSEINSYQRNRGLSLNMLQEIEVKEVIVGETTPEHCKEIFSWFWSKHEKDQKLFPTAVCSMDNEEIKISLIDVYRMAGKIETVFPRKISDELRDHNLERIPEDRWMQLPVRVMIGNGFSYALMITIVLERDSREEYMLNRIVIQDEILDFIESMPVCMGLGVRTDVADLEFYYSLFSGRDITCAGFLDLSALSVLAGYNMRAMSMTPMGANVLGHSLNKCVSTGDGKWSWRWEELPDSLKVYCLGDLRFGFMAYNVLSAVLIRDIFPDPDIVLKFLGIVDQFKAVKWILELFMLSLDGVEVHNVDFDAAKTRYEMIKSLRFRYSYDSPLMETSPARVLIWCEIIGDWPALTSGGCRFLGQAREWFITQARVLKSSGFKWTCGVKMKNINPYFLSYSRFGISPHIIHAAEYYEPVPAYTGLFRPSSMKSSLCQMNPSTVKPATLSKFVRKQGKVLKAVIFEWARYYPLQIQDFLQRMKDDLPFRHYMQGLYRGLRIIHKRINCTDAIMILELEEKFDHNLEIQLKEEEARKERSWELFRAREARCQHLTAVLRNKDQDDQSLWLDQIPKLPAWIPRRKGRKRVRSSSRPRSSSKRSRIQIPVTQEDQGSSGTRDPEDDGSEDVVVINEDDEIQIEIMDEEDFETPGINDPKPPCRKKIDQKRKKKKGKKSKSKKDTRTYDELIEAEKYMETDSEFDLQFDFTEHLA